jgi:surface protein
MNLNFANLTMSKSLSLINTFANSTGLQSVHVWNMAEGTSTGNMINMFRNCTNLSEIKGLENWNVSNTTLCNWAFANTNISSIDLSCWNASNLKWFNGMFKDCKNLTVANLAGLGASGNMTWPDSLFENCEKLTTIDMSGWDCGKMSYVTSMFRNCNNLTTIIGGFNNYGASFGTTFPQSTDRLALRFERCPKLTKESFLNAISGLYNLNAAGFNRQAVYVSDAMYQQLSSTEKETLFYNKGWFLWNV